MRNLGITLKVVAGVISVPTITLPIVAWVGSSFTNFTWLGWNWAGLIVAIILYGAGIVICGKWKNPNGDIERICPPRGK